jgi:hypothetical protein
MTIAEGLYKFHTRVLLHNSSIKAVNAFKDSPTRNNFKWVCLLLFAKKSAAERKLKEAVFGSKEYKKYREKYNKSTHLLNQVLKIKNFDESIKNEQQQLSRMELKKRQEPFDVIYDQE